jgi:hypothetical protein
MKVPMKKKNYGGIIQSLACHMIIHGYETATKYEKLLNE